MKAGLIPLGLTRPSYTGLVLQLRSISGNSITAAYAVEDFSGEDSPDSTYTNNYLSYSALIARHYPEANIICALGNMDATREGSAWPGYVLRAISQLNDNRIYAHFVSYKDSPGHPTIGEQEDMATSFIAFIDEHIDW